jgi:glycerol-3-phosphate acyltransferase PlsY
MTSQHLIIYVAFPLGGYLVGSVPFGFVIGKLHGVDIRTVGSKNIGATNLGRTLGKKYFWQAFLLDAAKGFFPVLIAALLIRGWNADPSASAPMQSSLPLWAPLITGVAGVIGHLFPIWLKFKGGKGVSTGFGAVLGFWPLYTLAGLIAGAFFVFMLMVYRYISLASMTASIMFVVMVAFLGNLQNKYIDTYLPWNDRMPLIVIAGAFSVMIIIRHRANIGRLIKGTEPQIGQKEIDKANLDPKNPPPRG